MSVPNAATILARFTVRAKFRHMQVLIKLAELGSMRRVAEAINMTQPAISQQVAELEKLIGASLFFRHAKGVEPTQVAKDLLPVAYRVLSALQDGSEAVASRLQAQSGRVRVAASPAAIGGLLLDVLGTFSRAHPTIQVQITETNVTSHSDGLLSDQADVICTRAPEIIPEGWQFLPCLEDRLIVVSGVNHPIAKNKSISVEELGQCRWLMNRVGSVARDRFEEAVLAHDWPESARGSLILHVPEITQYLIVNYEYLAILPLSVASPWLRGGSVKELKTTLSKDLPPLGVLAPTTGLGSAAVKFVSFVTQEREQGSQD